MIRKLPLVFIFLLVLVSPTFAREGSTDATTPAAVRESIKEKRQETKTAIQEKRAETKTTIQAQRESLRETIKMKRQEASEAAKSRREAFQAKKAVIKDERKKAILDRADKRLSEINTKRTDQMTEFLERLVKILDKIEMRKDKAKANGKDVSAVETAIVSARAAIKTAQDAVAAQAGKSYVITITDETALKGAVGSTTSTLQSDLQATRKKVIDAKQAVAQVYAAIASVKGVDDAQ